MEVSGPARPLQRDCHERIGLSHKAVIYLESTLAYNVCQRFWNYLHCNSSFQ